MSTLTPEELAEIEARTNAATPGPWQEDGPRTAIIVWGGPDDRVCFMTSDGPARKNAQFIAHARTDIPALLASHKAQAAEIERLTRERDACAEVAVMKTDGRFTAWLIEWLHNDAPIPRFWHPADGWVWGAGKAMRFCRCEDAQAYIDSQKWMAGKPTEHIFIGAALGAKP